MRSIKRPFVCLLCMLLLGAFFAPGGFAASRSDVQNVIDGILSYKCASVGAADVDALIDGDLTANAGVTADWYLFGLIQYGWQHDYSGFAKSLKRFAETNEVESTVTDERVALLFAAIGTEPDYIAQVTDSAVGKLGVMSYVYGLHLLNNGYRSSVTDAETVVAELLDRQLEDGGWAVMGTVGDVDVTAMTLSSLAPYYAGNAKVKQAADRALQLLSKRQMNNGGYKSFGQESPESAAQVLVALTSLGIDPLTDARFVKNGKTAFDAMLAFRLPDGSFEHAPVKGSNHTATVQAFYSCVALYRYLNGQPGLYVLQKASPAPATEPPTQKPTEALQPAATKKAETTTKKAETTTKPTAEKKAETATTSTADVTAAQAASASTTDAVTTGAQKESTTAVLSDDPGEAVSAIRPENSPTVFDFEEPGTTAEAETEPEERGGSPVAWVISGAALAALAAAAVLIKKKKA